MQKNDFDSFAEKLVSVVDFIKWTSSFGDIFFEQLEVPLPGVRLKPSLSNLFGVARDDAGWMLTLHEKEGAWLPNFPMSAAVVAFDDELLLVSERFDLLDVSFQQIGISLFIPKEAIRTILSGEGLLGFGLLSGEGETLAVQRVNRIVPLYSPDRYNSARINFAKNRPAGLFS